MSILDSYIFHILIFSPLLASVFITLIPSADTASKLAISRFFSIIIILAFIKTFSAYSEGLVPSDAKFSLNILNFNIQINLLLTKYNIFLYGTATIILFINMMSYIISDTKTNIHQVTPFILTFFLFVSFGQSDPRVALPILSITNFLLYFLIGSGEKIRRGSTIFQMGIFIFFCDALALILLQIPLSVTLKNLILLSPGLTRMMLPMLAPFTRKLILNVDEIEGPFLITFLQISGFFILVILRNTLPSLEMDLVIVVSTCALIGALYIALTAVNDHSPRNISYCFSIFYSSLSATILIISDSIEFYRISLCLLITNMACFLYASRFALFQSKLRQHIHPNLRSIWFMALTLFIGLPGLGIGTSLWMAIYKFYSLGLLEENLLLNFWRAISLGFVICLLIFSVAVMLSVKKQTSEEETIPISQEFKNSMMIAFVFIGLLSWLIPMMLLYKGGKGL